MYVLTPFTLHTLGEAGFGTWTLISSITGYLALLVLGVPMASLRYFTEHVADGDARKLNEAIGSCTALYLILGAVALLVGVGLYLFFGAAYTVPGNIRADAQLAFGITVLTAAFGFIGSLPNGILFAHDDFVRRNLIRLAGVVLRLGLTLGLLTYWPSLSVLALVQFVCLAFDFFLCAWLIRRRYPAIRIRLADFNWGMTRQILSFSVYVLVLNAGIRLSFETDSLVIGKFLDVSSIPYFTVANSFLIYLMEFIIAIAAVVMPMATRLKTQGRTSELREIFLKWSKIALSLTMMAGLFLIVLGPRFIAWWVDPSFEKPSGQGLQILLVSYLGFLPVRGVALPILMGLGKPGLPTIGFLGAAVRRHVDRVRVPQRSVYRSAWPAAPPPVGGARVMAWIAAAVLVGVAGFMAAELGARWWLRRRSRYHVWPPGSRTEMRVDPVACPELEPVVRFDINAAGERGA